MGKDYFDGDDGAQNKVVFQVKSKYFKRTDASVAIVWNSKSTSNQSLFYLNSSLTTKLIRTSYIVLGTDDYYAQDISKLIVGVSILNIYIAYKLSPKSVNTTNCLKNCLFAAAEADRPKSKIYLYWIWYWL